MAISPFQLNPFTSSSSPSLYFLSQNHASNSLRFKFCCCSSSSNSHRTVQIDTEQTQIKVASSTNPVKTRRKPRPSFYEQFQDKWSARIVSTRKHLPWEVQEEKVEEQPEEEVKPSVGSDVSSGTIIRPISAPWVRVTQPLKKPQIEVLGEISNDTVEESDNVNEFGKRRGKNGRRGGVDRWEKFGKVDDCVSEIKEEIVGIDETSIGDFRHNSDALVVNGIDGGVSNERLYGNVGSGDDDNGKSIRLPWKRENEVKGARRVTSKRTELAEKSIPEHELKRLQNVALRMLERIKVGEGGVTQALVDSIREKWENDEVVKLKFEGVSTLNMKRIQEVLEKRTGGFVIWRSGSSIVLFRGMTYKLQCAQSYTKQGNDLTKVPQHIVSDVDPTKEVDLVKTVESYTPISAKYLEGLSQEELMGLNELNLMLEDLGPRFIDWSGPPPLPIDADLLPPSVPGYKSPFRILPYGTRHCLRNKQMTKYRRLARVMAPHFALGRNRELQGLARAIVKLWERSAIVKIAIKRGVLNTLNERMAEEIKKLTGGTLLSRNKDYIVFYRGNDFMPPAVTNTLKERQNETELCQDDEDLVRQSASSFIDPNVKEKKGPLVAGTLAETLAAISRWQSPKSSKDVEEMMRESELAKHASLVRYLDKKLHLAKLKAKKAERALRKVQEYLEPTELPTDLETLSDEERFLFRKMGLSMRPFLLLGIRGVFDGTIENMHLHWKFRELVKIMVKGKSFPQVKHIAISLEAESGGVLVSIDKTTKGYTIIVYRGKNYQSPCKIRPRNLLSRRKALARSIELQRREALKHHIMDLEEQIDLLKSDIEETKSKKEIDKMALNTIMGDDTLSSDDEVEEDDEEEDGEEAYLEVYESGDDEESNAEDELKLKEEISFDQLIEP